MRIRAGSLAAADMPPPAPTGLRIVTSSPAPTMPSGPGPRRSRAAAELDWNLRTGGYGAVVGYPAKYNFDIAASNCTDVMYFTVDQAGTASAVNVIAITNSYAGCPGNSTGKTPTVKFGLRLATGTATSPVPSLDGKTLYVFESRTVANGGLILHAINVDNIVSNVGTYNFTTNVWSNAHTLAAPIGTAIERAEVPVDVHRRHQQRVVAVPRLRHQPVVLRRLGRPSPPRAQRQFDRSGGRHQQLPGLLRHAGAAVAGLRQRPGHRQQRRRQALPDRHDRARRPTRASRQSRWATARPPAAASRRRWSTSPTTRSSPPPTATLTSVSAAWWLRPDVHGRRDSHRRGS